MRGYVSGVASIRARRYIFFNCFLHTNGVCEIKYEFVRRYGYIGMGFWSVSGFLDLACYLKDKDEIFVLWKEKKRRLYVVFLTRC